MANDNETSAREVRDPNSAKEWIAEVNAAAIDKLRK